MDSLAKEKKRIIIKTSLISSYLLIVFLVIQLACSEILKLDVKWIIVSAVPLIIGLILSGVIKSFKGFGVELEMNLLEKVEAELVGKVECFPTTEITKQSMDFLFSLPLEKRNLIERLQLISGKKNYYDYYAVSEYINNLNNLKFIEIIDDNGRFKALLYANSFKYNHNNYRNEENNDKINLLIRSVERENYTDTFRSVITETITVNDSLTIAYKKFKNAKYLITSFRDQILPVLDSNDKMVGITSRIKLTEKIAEQVIKSEK